MSEGRKNIVRQLMEEFDTNSAKDIQGVLKELLGDTIKDMMEAETMSTNHTGKILRETTLLLPTSFKSTIHWK